MPADFSIDGLIRYFEMAYKVMGWTNPEENSYEYHAAKMLQELRDECDDLHQNYTLALCQLRHTKQITKELIHSNLYKTIADKVKVYNSIYTGNLDVEIDVDERGMFRFVYDCEPDIEDKERLNDFLCQFSGMVKLANNMIGGI